MAVEGLIAHIVPNDIPSLGYRQHRNGIVEKTVSVRGKVIERVFLYPSRKLRRRIGRGLRREKTWQ